MRNKNVVEWIANYIREEGFSVKRVAMDLKIPEHKLRGGGNEDLSAEEFLDLCSYLQVEPERIRKEIG